MEIEISKRKENQKIRGERDQALLIPDRKMFLQHCECHREGLSSQWLAFIKAEFIHQSMASGLLLERELCGAVVQFPPALFINWLNTLISSASPV